MVTGGTGGSGGPGGRTGTITPPLVDFQPSGGTTPTPQLFLVSLLSRSLPASTEPFNYIALSILSFAYY